MMKKTLYTSLYLLITGLTSVNGVTVKIQNSLINLCLFASAAVDGTPVKMDDCDFGSEWNIPPEITMEISLFDKFSHDSSFCLTFLDDLQIKVCQGLLEQIWNFSSTGQLTQPGPDSSESFKNCLQLDSLGQTLQSAPCNGSPAQKWVTV